MKLTYNNKFNRLFCVFLSLSFLILSVFGKSNSRIVKAAELVKTSNRFNVVFVLDSSGSMKDNDPNKLRCEAVSLFTGLLATSGNNIGSVVFSDHILFKRDMFEVTTVRQKKDFISELYNAEVKGWTNTGEALLEADNMLNSQGNPELPSVIIYLTDGNTEMASKEELSKSLEQKAEAIQIARDRNIKIFSVCLNALSNSDKTNPEEMEQISKATGGEFKEIHTADDLRDVYQQFYELIYSTTSTDIGGGHFDTEGFFSASFEIPVAGVEEVNIITSTESELKSMTLTKPDGQVIQSEAVENMTIRSKQFTITKINEPEGGLWRIDAMGSPDTYVEISMIFNAVLSISAEINNPKDMYEIGDVVPINTTIRTGDKIATDQRLLDDYAVEVSVTDSNGNIESLPIMFSNNTFFSEYHIKDYGTYKLIANVKGYGVHATSEPIMIYVGNTPPQVINGSLKKVGYIWPFIPLNCSIDLSEAVSDKEDKDLTYKVKSSSFMNDSWDIQGKTLSMKHFDISKGSFTIEAIDSMGASCEFEVYVSSRNIPLYVAILVGILILILLSIAAYGIYRASKRYYHAKLFISAFDENGELDDAELIPVKGRYKLCQCGLSNIGNLPGNAYLEPSGEKGQFRLVSKTKLFARGASNIRPGEQAKKICVKMEMTVTISADKDFAKGIRVRFEPIP